MLDDTDWTKDASRRVANMAAVDALREGIAGVVAVGALVDVEAAAEQVLLVAERAAVEVRTHPPHRKDGRALLQLPSTAKVRRSAPLAACPFLGKADACWISAQVSAGSGW